MDGDGTVALELERLRGAVAVGFAEVNGKLDGLGRRTTDTEDDVKELETRVSALEKRVWMAAGVAAVLSGGGAAGILAALGH